MLIKQNPLHAPFKSDMHDTDHIAQSLTMHSVNSAVFAILYPPENISGYCCALKSNDQVSIGWIELSSIGHAIAELQQ